jgi:NADH-quinone oxidoreductase subunit E
VGLNATKVGVDLVRLGRELEFAPADQAKVKEILARYPSDQRESAIMPVLWLAQERFGFISQEAIELTARSIDVSVPEVAGVATFYTMYHLEPVGRHVLQVCCTLSCSIMGAERIVAHLERKLGIRVGETTADGRFTLKKVECLASCGTAPMLQVNERHFDENLDEAAVDRLLETLK